MAAAWRVGAAGESATANPRPQPGAAPELLHHLLEAKPLVGGLRPAALHQGNVAIQSAEFCSVWAREGISRANVQPPACQHVGHQVPGVGGPKGQLPRQQHVPAGGRMAKAAAEGRV